MTTAVWRCEPRSHGRKKAGGALPGRAPISAVPHRSASPAVCPCGHSASFRRRASSFVRGFWSRRRCYLRRREAGGRGACGARCGARAHAGVLWLQPVRQCVCAVTFACACPRKACPPCARCMLTASSAPRAGRRRAARRRCWRGAGGRYRSWPHRGCRRLPRAWRRSGRGSGRAR